MKPKPPFLGAFLLVLLCACNRPTPNTAIPALQKDSLVKDSLPKFAQPQDSAQNTALTEEAVLDTILKLKFREFSLTINRLACFDEEKKLGNLQQDTAIVFAEIGESIEGQTLSIQTDQLTDLLVEQSHENSISVLNAGSHCDLTEWTHYYSEWKPLKINDKGVYVCLSYTETDYTKFPPVALKELKKAANEFCGTYWSKIISQIKAPNEYPCMVNLSCYLLRITGKRKDNGQIITKLIRIESPMGC